MTKNKLQRIAKNKLQIGKFVKNGSSNSNKSLTFLLVFRNLPGKANLKMCLCLYVCLLLLQVMGKLKVRYMFWCRVVNVSDIPIKLRVAF